MARHGVAALRARQVLQGVSGCVLKGCFRFARSVAT